MRSDAARSALLKGDRMPATNALPPSPIVGQFVEGQSVEAGEDQPFSRIGQRSRERSVGLPNRSGDAGGVRRRDEPTSGLEQAVPRRKCDQRGGVRPLVQDDVVDALAEHLEPERVILRLARAVPATPGRADGDVIFGEPADGSVAFLENGHTMTADPVEGQKTGYFLDQRSNRRSFGDLAEAGDVLDVFCCHGGFSVHAAAGGARSVLSTDLSPYATESARRHLAANAGDVDHQTMTGDAFEIMEQLAADGRRFDAIVVDPPSFARRADAVPGALRAYTRLTHLALDLLRPGATLMQASCTSRIDTEMLTQTVLGAAERAGHPVDVLDVSGHDLDHPVGFPEGSYLKAVTIRSQR